MSRVLSLHIDRWTEQTDVGVYIVMSVRVITCVWHRYSATADGQCFYLHTGRMAWHCCFLV